MKKILLILMFVPVLSFAQEEPSEGTSEEIIESFIEEISSNTDKEIDYTTLYEDLTFYLQEPLNLNEATKEQLEKLQVLSDFQIQNLIDYRKEFGQMLSMYELLNVNGFNEEYVRLILPFVTVQKLEPTASIPVRKAWKYGSHQIFLRTTRVLEQQEGFSPASDSLLEENPNARYAGDPNRLYFRYRFMYKNKITWGITGEKDPGEEFFGPYQKYGFDFYSAHLLIRDIGPIKTIALGDYYAQFGQGLVLWSGFSYGKSSMVTYIRRKAQGIKKYSGTDENLFFRGGAATLRFKQIDFTAFYSKKKIDANISLMDTITGELEEVSSLQSSGLHSIPSELADKRSLGEEILGGNLSFNSKYFRIGATAVHYEYDAPLLKTPSAYNQYEFSGSENSNISVDYQLSVRDVTIFGEAAASNNGGWATLHGALFSLSPQMNMALLYRNYQREYQSLIGAAFGENSRNANEHGMYIGTLLMPLPKWKVSVYYDLYTFPWLSYSAYAPSRGNDFLIQADYTPNRYLTIYARYKQEVKPENDPDDPSFAVNTISDVVSKKIRLQIAAKVSKEFDIRNRIEFVRHEKNGTIADGYLLYQDLIWKPQGKKYSFSARFAIFDTDTYDARIYAYENDILYAFSVPAYYEKGSRYYLNMKWSPLKSLDLWFRYSRTLYSSIDEISSGLSRIGVPHKSEIKIQARIRF